MLGLTLNKERENPLHILFLGAHSDDIEIGCGGTVLKLIQQYPNAVFHWIVFSAGLHRASEGQASAESFLVQAQHKYISIKDYRDSFFPYLGGEIKNYFEQLKQEVNPDLIFTHYRDDLHQDHRLICDLTWNTFRNHLILEYEIPKYDGDLGTPNFFVPLDESLYQQKIAYLLQHFRTQATKDWFAEDTFLALMRLRGMESKSPSKYAEAFYARKIVF